MPESLDSIFDILKSHENPDYAKKMKTYLKGQFNFFGLKAPERRVLQKSFVLSFKNAEFEHVKETVNELWKWSQRDGQYIGLDILSRHLKKLEFDDLSFLEHLITTKSWWDTVDWLASHGVGKYFNKFPEERLPTIEGWMTSDNIWLIRTSIIHQLFYKEKTDHDLLAALVLEQKDSKEFFINKASGWALRQYSKTNAPWVEEFINDHRPELSNLTQKEGMKWIIENK